MRKEAISDDANHMYICNIKTDLDAPFRLSGHNMRQN
jgi:hypothetical protein